MFEIALKLLEKIEEHGFHAYIVGGFVRDYVMGNSSNDVDVCTNALPKDIRNIFKDACLSSEEYGSITVLLKNVRFEITTFRREYSYINHRRPERFEFINDLQEDLMRRDFLMNTLCIDKEGRVLDFLGGKKDIDNHLIQTVGNSYQKFSEDAFRILRAVRFATILQFQLSEDIKDAIEQNKSLLRNLSYQRKREELDRIFSSVHVKNGIELLLTLGLDQELELFRLHKISNFDDLLGIWAQLKVDSLYPFTKNEHDLIVDIRRALTLDNLDTKVLYQYGLYVNSVAANIKGISKKKVTYQYNHLPIKCRSDICLNGDEISSILKKKPGPYLKEIFKDLETKILSFELENRKEALITYVKVAYS